jgi:hypothetical protein
MKALIKALLLLPLAAAVTIFAVAHRDPVTLSWNPLLRDDPTYQITVPLFAVVFAALALGVLIGGIGAWLGQGGHRKAERQHARTVDQQRRELEQLRAMRELPEPPPPSMLR